MPTTTKITKELILDTALEIAREKGKEGISNRELAKRMNCSIRPIYYQFKNVEQLNNELKIIIEQYFYKYLLINSIPNIPPYKQIGINYIKFAREEKQLFKILFMSKNEEAAKGFINSAKDEYGKMLKLIKLSTNLSNEEIESFHTKMWIFTHGIATLIATDTINFTDEQISKLLSFQFQAQMLLEENPNNKWVINKEK